MLLLMRRLGEEELFGGEGTFAREISNIVCGQLLVCEKEKDVEYLNKNKINIIFASAKYYMVC